MATPQSESFVHAFARGLTIIERMGQQTGRLTIAEIAQSSDLPRTAVRRFLLTLQELQFVQTDGRHYWLTPKVMRLGMAYLYTLPFWRHTQRVLEELHAEIGQSCAASVLDGADCAAAATAAAIVETTWPTLGSHDVIAMCLASSNLVAAAAGIGWPVAPVRPWSALA